MASVQWRNDNKKSKNRILLFMSNILRVERKYLTTGMRKLSEFFIENITFE